MGVYDAGHAGIIDKGNERSSGATLFTKRRAATFAIGNRILFSSGEPGKIAS